MPLASPVSSLRAARGTPMQAPGMGMPPSPYASPNTGPAGGMAKPTPAAGPAPTGYTPSGQPYSGVAPGDPTQVITPTGPAMRQVQPGGNITEWQPNQGAPMGVRGAVPNVPLDPGGVAAGGAPGNAGTTPDPTYGMQDLMKWLDKFQPQALPREYGAPRENERASESATFGRAAERIAQAGQGRERALRSYYANRGLSGSPVEAAGFVSSKNKTAGAIGDTIREQAVQSNARDMAVNDRNLASQVSQRGQDMGNTNWKLNAMTLLGGLVRQGIRP